MRVIQLSHSDAEGGAARAAYRIHHGLRETHVDSQMWVDRATLDDWTVQGPITKVRKGLARIRPSLGSLAFKPLFITGNPVMHSPASLLSGRVGALNSSDSDVLHLHWVQGEMLSVADIGRIRKPVVWTLHDMWAFCGAEHYTEDFRWREGYVKGNRPDYEGGFDMNRWTWQRKRKQWQRPMHIVTPSRWLAQCVRQSILMRDWPVTVVPNCLDTGRWRPLDKHLARDLLGFPKDVAILLFGAMGGGNDPRKGFDLLLRALQHLRGELKELELVVFGQLAPKYPIDLGFPIHYTGHLHDDLSLRALYSAADVMVVPSRQEAFGQTASEAHACGTPVVAFNVCGLPDVVQHLHTGYLAKPLDTEDLARGIQWVLAESDRHNTLAQQARAYAVQHFSNAVVADQYKAVYTAALNVQG